MSPPVEVMLGAFPIVENGSLGRSFARRGLATVGAIAALALASCASEDYSEPRCGENGQQRVGQYNGPGEIRGALAGLRRYRRYRLYYVGRGHAGLPLTSVSSACQPPAYERRVRRLPPAISPAITFSYGSCEQPPGEGGCPPPLSIRNFEICAINPHSHGVSAAGLSRVRGVPVLQSPASVEVYTGSTTIIVFARSSRSAMRAVAHLRSVDGRIGPRDKLPPPVAGALKGRLRCT